MSEYSKKDWSIFVKKNQLEQAEIKAELKKLESETAALKSSIAKNNEASTNKNIDTKEANNLRRVLKSWVREAEADADGV